MSKILTESPESSTASYKCKNSRKRSLRKVVGYLATSGISASAHKAFAITSLYHKTKMMHLVFLATHSWHFLWLGNQDSTAEFILSCSLERYWGLKHR